MYLLEEIRNNLNRGFTGKAMRITALPDNYPAWTIKQDNWYGVAIPVDEYRPFSEEFANARIWIARQVMIENVTMDCLILACDDPLLRNSFAAICTQFADPGENGQTRETVKSNPEIWWNEWKKLLGNRNTNAEVYSELGEMIVLEKLLEKNKNPVWKGPDGSVHDIECPDESYEVKSTVQRYGYTIKASNTFQMDGSGRLLNVVFCRFEESLSGISLNDMAVRLQNLGYPEMEIERLLRKKGLEKGKTARNKKYKLLEMGVYPVDENFPVITKESFVGGRIPDRILHLTYEIDLAGLVSREEP